MKLLYRIRWRTIESTAWVGQSAKNIMLDAYILDLIAQGANPEEIQITLEKA